jgi:hypothetical protein
LIQSFLVGRVPYMSTQLERLSTPRSCSSHLSLVRQVRQAKHVLSKVRVTKMNENEETETTKTTKTQLKHSMKIC